MFRLDTKRSNTIAGYKQRNYNNSIHRMRRKRKKGRFYGKKAFHYFTKGGIKNDAV